MKLFGNRRRAAHTKKSALSRGTRTALIAAVIVLAVAGSAFAAWKLLVKPVERPALSEPEPEPPAEEEAPEPSAVPVTPQELEPEQQPEEDVPTEQPKALRDGVYNILICGTDGDGYRTDTIIVAHLDANTHTVALLSIPRDTPVATGGGGTYEDQLGLRGRRCGRHGTACLAPAQPARLSGRRLCARRSGGVQEDR